MASPQRIQRNRREGWLLLLIPIALLMLDSYGWFPHSALPTWTQSESTVYRVKAEQPQQLSVRLAQPLSGTAPVKARLENKVGDVRPLVTEPPSEGKRVIDLQIPTLPAGHYELLLTQGEQPLIKQALHVIPNPSLALDRYFVQAGESLSLWRNQPSPTVYRLGHLSEQTLSAQNPHPILLPEDLPAGKYQITLQNGGSTSFEVLDTSGDAVSIKPHHDLVLPGVDQTLYLHVLDAQHKPLKQGWIRFNEQSYAINAGLAIVPLPAKSIQSELLFTAGVAEGQIQQGRLTLQPAAAAWGIALIPAHQDKAQYMQWIGKRRTDLHWQAQQGIQSLSGKLSSETPLNELYTKLQDYFKSDRPVSLRLVDAQGQGQSMAIQFPPRPTTFSIQPTSPHALSTLTIKTTPSQLPWVNHYVDNTPASHQAGERSEPVGQYAWNTEQAVFSDEPTEESSPRDWRFLWLLTGLLCSALPWWRAQKQTHQWHASLQQSKTLTQARRGILLGACLWIFSLPAAWLGQSLFLGQTYLLGLAISSFCIIWGLRKVPLLQPIWMFTQTAILLLCFWFNFTYWPEGQTFIVLWSGLLTLGWLSLYERWQRSAAPLNSTLVFAASLMALSMTQSVVSFQSPSHSLQTQANRVKTQSSYPVIMKHLAHSQSSPATFSLKGQGGVHLLSSTDLQGLSEVQALSVMETPRVQAQAPAIAQQNDSLQLPITLTNPTPGAATVPIRLQGPQLNTTQTLTLKAGESQSIRLPIRFHHVGINTYTLSQYYDNAWHTQNWQTYINPAPTQPSTAPNTVKFSPLRLQINYPEQTLQVGGEISVVVDFQHRLPEDVPLSLSIGIPAGFTAITDTLDTDKSKTWLADFRPSTSSLNLETTVLRAGQRVRFHYRLKAEYAGQFQTPEAVLSNAKDNTQRELASSTLLNVKP